MTMRSAFTLVFCLCFVIARGHKNVSLPEGEIRGTTMTARNGRSISAYLGIPYAEPPLGPLRFQIPKKKAKFDSVLEGDTDGNMCPQSDDNGRLIGDEDCLYLNVYTPEATPGLLYPVMVYIHGGNYVEGSGTSKNAGPDYFLTKDIVLVTINYRLGALGFLSTGDAQASGNFGLKDQNVALKWVRDNIGAFGGNPDRVTIFGPGAGGASSGFHAISPASRGLFQQYISQSGNAFTFWVFHDIKRYASFSTDLGKKLDCPTENSQELVECLRDVNVDKLVNTDDIFENELWPFTKWGPTIEKRDVDGAFLTDFPMREVMERGISDIPSIIGNVKDEGLTIYDKFADDASNFFTNLTKVLFPKYESDQFEKKAKQFYFNGSDLNDGYSDVVRQGMTEFITDAGFFIPMELQIRATTNKTTSPVYEYSFDYRGTFSRSTLTSDNGGNRGVAHGDDLIYLFPKDPKLNSPLLQFSGSDKKMIDTMIDLWTSFAATGTPRANSESPSSIWEPYDGKKRNYLKIGSKSGPELTTQEGLRMNSSKFWKEFVYYLLAKGNSL